MKDKQNLKATMGTVVHKCMETLGNVLIAKREGKRKVKDEIFNHTFKQLEDLELISKMCYDYYSKHVPELSAKFTPKVYKQCHDWFLKALAYRDGEMDPRNQDIFAVEQFFDIEIKKPWAKYRYDVDGEVIEGNLSIKGTVDVIVQHDEKYFQILDYKGLPLDTPLLTTDGWTTMGDIQVGDTVYDRFGKQTKVTVKSRVKYRDCYKITFDDKTVAECDDEHYWTLSDNSVVQAPDLVEGMKIDVAKPIENDELDLPVDPYLLGVWLGDGRKRGCEITCGDTQVFKEIENRGYCLGVDQHRNDSERNCECRIVKDTTHKLRSLGLLDNKHIPEIYFKASHNQRLDLLRGLMDSDGSVNPLRKQCVFMNTNKKLSEDTCYLLRTLGQRPYLCTTKQTYKGRTYNCYPVHFRPVDIKPFNVDRKNNKIDPNWGAGASSVRRITKIEKVEKKKTQCISVDSPDSTYLCTKNLIPTHNTGKRIDWATGEVKTQKKLEKDVQLLLYYYALKNMFPDY
jgi:intein/homing endonuclease